MKLVCQFSPKIFSWHPIPITLCVLGCVAFLFPKAAAGETEEKTPVKVDLSSREARAATVQRLRKQAEQRRAEAEAFAAVKNWPVRGQREDGVEFELFAVIDGRPYYRKTEGTNAAISTGANLIRQTAPYNLDGAGWTVGIWDAALALPTHQEFGPPTRISSPDGTTTTSRHSTIVASIIGASGISASAQGMAPAVTIHCYNTINDRAELAGVAAATAGQAGKIFLSNFSFGFAAGWARSTAGPGTGNPAAWHWFDTWGDLADDSFGQYSTFTREFDEICYNAPYHLVFKSAGNEQTDGPSNGETIWHRNASNDWVSKVYNPATDPLKDGDYENGYDTLPTDKAAKNLVVVGAVNDAVTTGVRDPAKATLYNRSSWGPVDDGRIKPDIVANGTAIRAAVDDSDTDYAISTSTSFASANASGSAVLLNELYTEQTSGETMRSSTLRGLIIHTATDIGNPGPDYQNGWGLMNVKDAADLILADVATPANHHIVEATLNAGNPSDSYTLNSNGTMPLKVTICWTDPPGVAETDHDNRTPDLVNDLDIRLTAPGGATLTPFVLDPVNPALVATTGDNIVDNIEQILVAAPAAGAYTVTVNHKGSLTNGQQVYSLITGGATSAPPPDVDLRDRGSGFHSLSPASVIPGQTIDVDADVENTGSAASGAFVARFYLSTDTTIDGSDTLLGEKAVASLGAGSVTAIDSTLTVPGSTTAGNYYVGWQIDAAGQIIETNETNNTAHITTLLTVTTPPGGLAYFDITFEEAKHVVGQAPAIGGTDSPSQINFGSPEVVNFGGSKVLKINAPISPTSSQTLEQIKLNIGQGASFYSIEFDVYIENLVLPPSGFTGEAFSIFVENGPFETLAFQPFPGNDLQIRNSQTAKTGNYVHGQWYECKIETDIANQTWKISIDGVEEHSGAITLDPDLAQIRFSLADRDGAGDAVVYLDNIKVTGPPPPNPPNPPTGVTATDGTHTDRVAVSWNQVVDATGYRIFRNTSNDSGGASEIGMVGETNNYSDFTAAGGTNYYYWIKSENANGIGEFSASDSGFRPAPPSAPGNVIASDGSSPLHVSIIWDAAADATSYRVFRSDDDDSGNAGLLDITTNTFYSDVTAIAGQVYFYWIRGNNAAGTSPFSASDSGFKLAPPPGTAGVIATDNTSFNQVNLTWSATASATSYRIFRSTTDNPGSAVEIGTSLTAAFDDFTAVPGQVYLYWIRGENAAGLGPFGTSESGQRSIATPDLHIGKNAAAKIGDDLYSDTGINQRIRQISKKGRKLHYYFCVENDGTLADVFDLTGSPGNRLFRPLFRDENGANVTAEVIAGTFQANLGPAGDTNLKLEVKPGRPAIGKRKRRTFVVRIDSTEDAAKSDAGQARAETKKERKKRKSR